MLAALPCPAGNNGGKGIKDRCRRIAVVNHNLWRGSGWSCQGDSHRLRLASNLLERDGGGGGWASGPPVPHQLGSEASGSLGGDGELFLFDFQGAIVSVCLQSHAINCGDQFPFHCIAMVCVCAMHLARGSTACNIHRNRKGSIPILPSDGFSPIIHCNCSQRSTGVAGRGHRGRLPGHGEGVVFCASSSPILFQGGGEGNRSRRPFLKLCRIQGHSISGDGHARLGRFFFRPLYCIAMAGVVHGAGLVADVHDRIHIGKGNLWIAGVGNILIWYSVTAVKRSCHCTANYVDRCYNGICLPNFVHYCAAVLQANGGRCRVLAWNSIAGIFLSGNRGPVSPGIGRLFPGISKFPFSLLF